MPVLTEEEQAGLHVENFIFHAVHNGSQKATLYDEVPIGPFEDFFIGRVVDTLKGNRFVFNPTSATLQALRDLEADPSSFATVSKDLARRFHGDEDRRIKNGILIVMALTTNGRRIYSLIKYDYGERVLDVSEQDTVALLTAVTKPITENKKALQKSALIEFSDDGGNLVVIDHSERSGITNFFRAFLDVTRAQGEPEMTMALSKSLLRTMQAHANELPTEITTRWKQKLADIALRRRVFDVDELFGDMFGANGSPGVRVTYDAQLAAAGLDGESFTFDSASLSPEGPRKFRTSEGIDITVPAAAQDTFSSVNDGDTVVITIRTSSLRPR